MFKRILGAALLFGLAGQSPPAYAQSLCFARDQLTKRLAGKFSEVLRGGGFRNAQSILEVWTSANGATWTLLITRPDGVSCVVATGTEWHVAPDTPKMAGVSG